MKHEQRTVIYNKDYSIVQAFILMAIIVPITGELNMYPFNESFRISFGMPAFFFFLLLWPKNNPMISGLIVGVTVVIFRMLLDIPISDFPTSFIRHYPTSFYYIIFGVLFHLAKINKRMHLPLLVGFLGVLLDIISSSAELLFQYIAFDAHTNIDDLHKISVIAIFRSFFIVGSYNLITLQHTRIKKEQVEQENEKLITLITELYEESTNLKKTLINSENVTEKSYNLYRSLKIDENNLSKVALEIAGESHEIKKDNQRILSGLARLISDENVVEYVAIQKIIHLSIHSNAKYAVTLKKDISITYTIQGEHPPYHLYMTLSMINNLVTNAIEAIDHKGHIHLHLYHMENGLIIEVQDDGPGIKREHMDLIFEPGFTSKYDEDGSASTGIGLSYVKSLVTNLHGDITMQSGTNGVIFTITLPENYITARKDDSG